MKNGVEKKRFRKPHDNRQAQESARRRGDQDDNQEDQDITSLVYWEAKDKNNLLCASWDRNLYVFDDNDPCAREGQFRYQVAGRKPNSRLNYVDFWPETKCTATASDDGFVSVQNHQN